MKKKYSYGFAIVLGLFCASMFVSFILNEGKKANNTLEETKTKVNIFSSISSSNEKDIKDYLEEAEGIAVKFKDNQGLPLDKKDAGVILAKIRTIGKIKVPDNDDGYNVTRDNIESYSIINEDKGYMINIYKEGYIELLHNDLKIVYSSLEMNEVMESIDTCIIDRLVINVFNKKYSAIKLDVLDDSNEYNISRRDFKELGDKVDVIGLSNVYSPINASIYPNYKLMVMKDIDQYNIHIVDETRIRVTNNLYDVYFDVDRSLWKFLDIRYPVRNIIAEDDIKYLLKCQRVDVHDIYDEYDLSTDGDFRLILARSIVNADGDLVLDKKVINDDFLQYTLTFSINNSLKDVNVYKNYYTYNDNVYHKENIYETIKSLIIMP